jgi:hypothetical protein
MRKIHILPQCTTKAHETLANQRSQPVKERIELCLASSAPAMPRIVIGGRLQAGNYRGSVRWIFVPTVSNSATQHYSGH